MLRSRRRHQIVTIVRCAILTVQCVRTPPRPPRLLPQRARQLDAPPVRQVVCSDRQAHRTVPPDRRAPVLRSVVALLEDLTGRPLPEIGVAFLKAVGVALLAREPAIDDVALAVCRDQRIQSAALGVIPFAALPPIVHVATLRRGKAQTLVHAFNLCTAPAPTARGRLEAMSAVVPEPPPALDVQQVARIVQRNHANVETTSSARRARTRTASVRGLANLATPELVIADPRCTCPFERGPSVAALWFVQWGNDGRWDLH